MIRFANPLHNTFLVAKTAHYPLGATCALRAYDGEAWDEALARQSFPGCTAAWVRERWAPARLSR